PGNVFVDGKAVGATPLDVPVAAGQHEVEVEYPGGSHDKRTVDVAKDGSVELTFKALATDALARYRKGIHLGYALGPAMAAYLGGGPPLFGGTASFVFNFGLTPTFELRSGVTAAFLYDTVVPQWEFTVVVPVLLKVNYTPWFSFMAGGAVGFIGDQHLDWNG